MDRAANMGFFNKPVGKEESGESVEDERLIVENVEQGGLIHIRNYGPDMEDIDVEITRKNMYCQKQFCWYELQGSASNGKQVFLEIDREDELELDISIDRELGLSDIGLTKSDLEEIDEAEEGKITFQGKVYEYDDSDEAFFYRDCDEENERAFYYWDFYNDDLEYTITVKEWERGGVDVTLTQSLREDQIEVYSLRPASD